MKTLALGAPSTNGTTTIARIELVKQAMEGVNPEAGITVADMRRRHRVLDAVERLDADATELPLDDADAACLAQCLEVARWVKVCPEVLALADAVDAMLQPPDADAQKDRRSKHRKPRGA